MEELTGVLEEAWRLYDEEDYGAAHDLLWKNAMEHAPNLRMVLLLSMSLNRQEFSEMLTIFRKYRDVFDVKKGVAEVWVKRYQSQAIDLCTDLLEIGSLTRQDELDIRWARIRATTRQLGTNGRGRYDSLADDFSTLWSFGDVRGGMLFPYSRKWLLLTVTEIRSPAAIPALQKLSNESSLSDNLKRFFEKKAAELMALEEVTRECDQPIMNGPLLSE